jgi:hypothetical protein
MALSVKSSGSQTATLDSTHTLLSSTDAGVYVLSVDLALLAVNVAASLGTGEVVELTILKKVRTGDTVRQVFSATYVAGAIPSPIVQSEAVVCPFGADFKLKQPTTTGSTGRAFPWSIEQLDT